MSGRVVVISGPTAVGKGTLVNRLRRLDLPDLWVSVSATTRAPRPGEQNGRDYLFVSEEEFDHLIATGGLLEWAEVHGAARYGTPREPVEAAIAEDKVVLLEIELQGARQVRRSWPGATFIFLAPPSTNELVRRLAGRGTETPEVQQRRLRTAEVEMAARHEFDHIVVNDDVSRATQQLLDLLRL